MKIKSVITAIVLVLTCAMVVSAQRRAQRQSTKSVKVRPTPKTQPESPEAALVRENVELVEKELATLSKLADTDKVKLRITTDNLQKEIIRTRLGDALTKSLHNLAVDTGTKSSL